MDAKARMQYAALARADIASDQEAGRAKIANKERPRLRVDGSA